jgi:hypothetical protein
MAFDPSTIQDISAAALTADPAGAQGKALTLASLYDENTLNKIKVGEAKQDQSDLTYAKQILQGKDLSKLEDQNSAVAEITKRSPKLGMQLAGQFSKASSDKSRNTMDQLDLYKAKNDILGADLIGLKAKHDQVIEDFKAKNPQATPQALEQATHDAMQGDVVEWVKRTSEQKLPDGSPLLNDTDKKTILAGLGKGYSTQWVNQMVAKSAEGKAQLAQKLKERELAVKEGGLGERVREDKTKDQLAQEKAEQAKKDAAAGIIDDDAAHLAANRILNGEQARDVLANYGRGKQGPQNISKVQNLMAELAKDRGLSSQDISARMIEMKGIAKEQQTEASIAGKITYAEKEIQKIAPKVLEISEKVPRGVFVPWNKLQNMTREQISDPNLKQLKTYLTTLTNSYDVLGGRGGTDVDKRAHNRELLNAADGPQALKAAVDAIVAEASLSHEAARESMQVDRTRMGGPAPTSAPPATAAPPAKVLRFDAQGNPVP